MFRECGEPRDFPPLEDSPAPPPPPPPFNLEHFDPVLIHLCTVPHVLSLCMYHSTNHTVLVIELMFITKLQCKYVYRFLYLILERHHLKKRSASESGTR